MTTHRLFPSAQLFAKFLLRLTSVIAVLATATSIRAAGPGGGGTSPVIYNPNNTQPVQGDAPLVFVYTLTVTSPATISGPPGPISMTVTTTVSPDGVDPLVAAGFVTFSQPVLTFSGPNVSAQTVVTLRIPVGTASGDFAYLIKTSGWSGTNWTDAGTFVNAHLNTPSGLLPPTVTISNPADGTIYTHVRGTPPLMIDVITNGSANANAPVIALTTELSGVDVDGVPIVGGLLDQLLTGLGSATVDGIKTITVTKPGTYHLLATAVNFVGTSTDTADFIVNEVVPPPTVTIDPPANHPTYTYVRGLTSVTVPYTFTGISQLGGVRSLTANLDGNPITTATIVGVGGPGVGQLTATGTGTFTFDAATANGLGEHTIDVTVTDDNGTASTSADFTVAEQVPDIRIDIANPIDGATIPLPPDASPLNIPYNFTSTTTFNAPIKTVAATLTSDEGVSSLTLATTNGLNTPTVTGSGVLPDVLPGVYTLGATSANSGLSLAAFDSAQFTVTPPPPPVIVFTQSPQATYTVLTGYTVTIPVAIKTTSTGTPTNPGPAYISTQSLTLDGQPITLTSNTANGTAFLATGGATLTVPAPTAGTTVTHTLAATGTDAYGQITTTQTTFDVTGNDPVITIAINPQIVANSPYTLPAGGGSLTIPFTFTGTITTGATVDTIVGSLGSTAVTITSSTGLGTSSTATGSGTMTISSPGTYTLTATDTNTKSDISATTSVQFVVQASQALPPLTVTITQPPLPSYTLVKGACPLSIPITFVGKSNNGYTGGYVSTMSATLDGKAVSLASVTGIGTPTSTATAKLSVSTAGTHVLVVKDTDKYGQTATTSTTFVVVIQNPVITVTINTPGNNSCFILPCSSSRCGSTSSLKIPFTFTSNITAGATIDALSAMLNGCSVYVTSTGLGTATAQGSGTLTVSQVGTYTLTAKGIDNTAGISATSSVTFTVKKAGPPTVQITQPTATTYSTSSCSALSIPFLFKATSDCGGVTSLSATLDGACVPVTSSGLGTLAATGSGTVSVSCAGTHKLTVTAKDGNGTACATFTFKVTVTPCVKYTVQGTVFFDINFNGLMDTDDYGLSGVKVTLMDSTGYGLATATTDASGNYAFSIPAGSYLVHVAGVNGMSLTTLNDQAVKVTNSTEVAPKTGYGLKLSAIRSLCANGYTIGYWKNNLDKAISGKCNGVQVGGSTMKAYTTSMGNLSLEPFDGITPYGASATMSSNSSDPAALLAKQLVASEYNYLSGGYIGGDRALTYAFITYAESVLKRSTTYSSTYIIFVKDWCDAYNNSHGGKVLGPLQ